MADKQGLTVKRTQELVDDFLNSYNGNIGVSPIVKDKQEDIYGEQNSKENYGFEIAGAYHPSRKIITLVASNLRDEKEAQTTIRHELLGHYGLNTFKPSEKLALLSMVRDTQTFNEPSLKKIWDKVNSLYPEKNSLEKAEEVFAFVAEEPQTFLSKAWDKVTSKFNQILRSAGLTDSPLSKSELRIEANKVAEGIRNGERHQQTFPANDNEQFKRIDHAMKKEKKPYHQSVAEQIIKQLEEGTAPWQKPWNAGSEESFLPYNPISGNRYRGINTLHLLAQGKEDRRWLTYNQAKKLGAQVKAGEKGTTVQYWKFTEERTKLDEKTGKPLLDSKGKKQKETVKLERPKVFYASVFNAEQIDNMPPVPVVDKKEQEWSPLERVDNLLKASGANISHTQNDRAFYRSSTDEIHMPRKELFDSADKYYATALHELGHWTGHHTRLDRPLNNPFGSEAYAKEELRAEISSMILGEELQIGHDPEQHSAYVKSWIKVLKDDPLEIFRAAAEAEKINTFVLSLEQSLEQKNEQQVNENIKPENVRTQNDMGVSQAVNSPNEVDSFLREQLIESGTALHKETNSTDYNPITSYLNLVKTASELGFEAFLQPENPSSEYENLQVGYKRGDVVYPVKTELLLKDGKALTTVNDERLNVTSYTEETAWQSDSLHECLLHAERDLILNGSEELGAVISEITSNVKNGNELAQAHFQMNAVEAAGTIIRADENSVANENSIIGDLIKDFEKLGQYIEFMENKEVEAVLSDKQIEEQLSPEMVEAWDELKEQAFFKAATPSLMIDRETNVAHITYEPNNVFADLSCTIENGEVKTKYNGEEMESLEQGLNAALLHSIHQQNNSDKENVKTEATPEPLESSPELSPVLPESKHYIDVPYSEKDEAKELGAKWDKAAKSWYAPANFPIEQFSQWDNNNGQVVSNESAEKVTKVQGNEKQFLAVPYSQKNEAKAAGAKWDRVAKSWYADSSSDMSKLQKFVSDKNIAQEPSLSPKEEFTETLKGMKAVISGDHPIMDGKKHRIECEGDKKGETSGFYVGHLDGHPAGYFMNNRTGQEVKWKSKGYSLSEEEKAILNAESAKKTQQRNEAEKANHSKVSKDVTEFFMASPSTNQHQYLTNKNISGEETRVASTETLKHLSADSRIKVAKSFSEAKALREADPDNIVFNEGDLLIPAKDKNNKIWSLQNIQPNGRKGFAKGGKKSEHYCVVGNTSLENADVIIIGEGYATTKSIDKSPSTKEANAATVTSFDSANLINVAKQLRNDYPDKPIVIAGEDDKKAELKPPHFKNVGKEKAIEAAKAINGVVSLPVFAQGEAENGLSDYNDLEVKSKLGSTAVDRQLRASINKALSQKLEQQQLQKKLVQEQNKKQGIETPKRKVASR